MHRFMFLAFAASLPMAIPAAGALDLNTADVTELSQLEGIDETLARRIVDYRRKNGDFRTVHDLLRIPGVMMPVIRTNQDRLTTHGIHDPRRTNKTIAPAGR